MITVLLVVFYFFLQFLSRAIVRFNFLRDYQESAKSFLHHFILVYEAIAVIILIAAFILSTPMSYHTITFILFILGFIASFGHIRNYVDGRLVLFNDEIEIGKRLQMADSQGVVYGLGRLGLRLKTSKGLKFVSYSHLLKDGYTMLSGSAVGGFHHLNIQPIQVDEKVNYFLKLTDLLNSTPYIDWNHKPQIFPQKDISKTMEARVVVKEESHLTDLMTMIEEQGFHCRNIS